MAANSQLCQAQLEAIIAINDTNRIRELDYTRKLEEHQKKHSEWNIAHNKWEEDKKKLSKLIHSNSYWVEVKGKAVDCDNYSRNVVVCCRDASLGRKKCTLQGKGSKCRNSGTCTWFKNNAVSCCKGSCKDKSENYCKNASVTGLPLSESRWSKEGYAEPVEPIFNESLVFEEYPAIICQDCSTSIESLQSSDILFEQIEQATQCINTLQQQELQEAQESEEVTNAAPINDPDNGINIQNENGSNIPNVIENTNSLAPNGNTNGNTNGNANETEDDTKKYFGFFSLGGLISLIIGIILLIVLFAFVFGGSSEPSRNIRPTPLARQVQRLR